MKKLPNPTKTGTSFPDEAVRIMDKIGINEIVMSNKVDERDLQIIGWQC